LGLFQPLSYLLQGTTIFLNYLSLRTLSATIALTIFLVF